MKEAASPMRIFIASLATETNTFAPFPTGRAAFEQHGVAKSAAKVDSALSGPLRVFRKLAEADGHVVIESLSAFATPSGRTVRAVYEEYRDIILSDLAKAGPVDVVLLMLHGAMVAVGYDDCEGDLIDRVRALAPDAVVGVELDPHCHLTRRMVGAADLVVIAREYPHIDFDDRAHDLYGLALATASGLIHPVAALVDCRVLGFYPTLDSPMKEIVERFREISQQSPVLTAELAHGFPWADVPQMGSRVLVYADADPNAAAATAEQLAEAFYAKRHTLTRDLPDIATSLKRARELNGRTVLGDFADNPGGGAPGDSTFFLRGLLEAGIQDAVIGALWDPFAVSLCADAGVGAVLSLRIGGKSGPMSGDPVDLEVEVMGVKAEHSCGVFGQRQPMGLSAWVRGAGLDIVLCSIRTQVFEPDAFTGLGVPLGDRRLIVVKSSNHYRAGFEPIADQLWHVGSPGTMSLDFANTPYTQITRPMFPFDDDPWADAGRPPAEIFSRASGRVSNKAAR